MPDREKEERIEIEGTLVDARNRVEPRRWECNFVNVRDRPTGRVVEQIDELGESGWEFLFFDGDAAWFRRYLDE